MDKGGKTKIIIHQFKKRPLIVEAVRLTEYNLVEVKNWVGSNCGVGIWGGLVIDTLEGSMISNIGDWIIKGVKGEFYPCKDEVFIKTYESNNSSIEI